MSCLDTFKTLAAEHEQRWFEGFNDAAQRHIERGLVPLSVAVDLSREGGLAIQAGGCYGLYPVALASTGRFSLVGAFEAMPENYAVMLRNVTELDLEREVGMVQCALGDVDGVCPVRSFPGNPGGSRIGVDDPQCQMEVDMRMLDTLVDDASDVTLIQLDVENWELPVLKGGQRLIERCRPVIMIETDHDPQGFAARWIEDLGYRQAYASETDAVFVPK